MMQEYPFTPDVKSSSSAATAIQPSIEAVRNILQFARCCQSLSSGDVRIKVYLN